MLAMKLNKVGTEAVAVETITPEIARKLLKLDSVNFRPLNLRWAKSLAEDMRAGRWDLNGESIKFDNKGHVVDGQHRLQACVLSNSAFQTVVMRGVTSDLNIDFGRKRSLADIFHARGEKSTAALAGSLRWLRSYELDSLSYGTRSMVIASNSELIKLLEQNPLIRESVNVGLRVGRLASTSMSSAFHYIFRMKASKEDSDRFFDALINGADLNQNDPLFHLRGRLLKNQNSTHGKLGGVEIAALFIKAWNAWIQGRAVINLRYRSSGPRAEAFPAILSSEDDAPDETSQREV